MLSQLNFAAAIDYTARFVTGSVLDDSRRVLLLDQPKSLRPFLEPPSMSSPLNEERQVSADGCWLVAAELVVVARLLAPSRP